jgi:hypothetical protein
MLGAPVRADATRLLRHHRIAQTAGVARPPAHRAGALAGVDDNGDMMACYVILARQPFGFSALSQHGS